jgi:hypothetical protein
MVRLGAAAAVIFLVWAHGGIAQDAATEGDVLAEAIARNPDRLADRLVDLVAGFGQDGGLTAEGIAEHIALERAGARAASLRRYLAMDLDADGSIGGDELAAVQRAASAGSRGRMERDFAAADTNGNGRLDAGEIAAAGQAAALRSLDEGEADLLRAAMRLDANADGRLTAREVMEGIARLAEAG